MSESYQHIRPSVVAIVARTSSRPDFPEIIGTGVVVHPDGFVLTNDHVAKKIFELPRIKGAPDTEWPALALFLHNVQGSGMAEIFISISGVFKFRMDPLPDNYYGGQPDLAILHIGKVKNLPHVKIAEHDLPVGSDVGILGFPMGTDTLAAPGWIHQISPTLQKGIVSAQLPFECDAPHAIMIDAVTEGGSSGSPIFDPTNGELIGLLHAGLLEHFFLISPAEKGSLLRYAVPTAHTLAISNFWIRTYMKNFFERLPINLEEEREKRKDFIEYINTTPVEMNKPKGNSGVLRPIPESQIETGRQ